MQFRGVVERLDLHESFLCCRVGPRLWRAGLLPNLACQRTGAIAIASTYFKHLIEIRVDPVVSDKDRDIYSPAQVAVGALGAKSRGEETWSGWNGRCS